jgi:hypothetical protein
MFSNSIVEGGTAFKFTIPCKLSNDEAPPNRPTLLDQVSLLSSQTDLQEHESQIMSDNSEDETVERLISGLKPVDSATAAQEESDVSHSDLNLLHHLNGIENPSFSNS